MSEARIDRRKHITPDQRTGGRGAPGRLSRWLQHKMNARTNARIRAGGGQFKGMDLLILHTVGRRSGQPRQSPLAWFAEGPDAWLVVASGGGHRHPDWYRNLIAHAGDASIELPGGDIRPVTPQRLDGAERAQAWQRITAAQPRYAKYQRKTDREYPVLRLAARPSAVD
jgi:deazaflavin-dependent oxidoreductase (nitroreductase family)